MNLLIKSSFMVLLAAVSGVYASGGIGERTGIQAANEIVDHYWCRHESSSSSSNRSINAEERARKIAIRTCQSETTIRNAINALCPKDRTPRSRDIFNLGNRCEKTVNSLIGRPPSPTPKPTRSSKTNKQCKKNRDCPGSQVCNRGRCVRPSNNNSSTCRRNNDCRSGQRCNDAGRCVRSSNRQPRSGKRCKKRSDCGSHRFCGSNGRCQRQDMEFEEFMAKPISNKECERMGDCSRGQICNSRGKCVPRPYAL